MADEISAKLKAAIFDAYGSYPIVEVREFNADREMDLIYDNFVETLDLEKIDQIDYGINYVERFIQRIITLGYQNNGAKRRLRVSEMASRKYSFGDTPSWWTPMVIEQLDPSRIIIDLDIEIG